VIACGEHRAQQLWVGLGFRRPEKMTKVGYAADTVAHICPKEAKYHDVIVTPIMIDIFSSCAIIAVIVSDLGASVAILMLKLALRFRIKHWSSTSMFGIISTYSNTPQ